MKKFILLLMLLAAAGGFAYMQWGDEAAIAQIATMAREKTGAAQEKSARPLRTEMPVPDAMQFFTRQDVPGAQTETKKPLSLFISKPRVVQAGKLPVVLFLHGSNGTAPGARFAVHADISASFPAIVIVPELPRGDTWMTAGLSPADDMEGMTRLADVIRVIRDMSAADPDIDLDRIYVIGCSEGGTGAYGAARYYNDFFAAAVPISGNWKIEDATAFGRIPMWAFHGAQDTGFPATQARALAVAIKGAGGNIAYTEFADQGHNCPAPAFYSRAMWTWMFAQKKNEQR